jgi:hypothetical protein
LAALGFAPKEGSNLASVNRYEAVISQVLNRMQAEFRSDLHGLLLGGSVAYGIACPRSDLDIYVITRLPWRQRRTIIIDAVEVELFINPVHQIRQEFQDIDHPATFGMFANGRVLYDADGVMAALVHEAKQIWQQPRPEVRPEALSLLRYVPTDLLKDAQDLAEIDETAADYLLHLTLQATLDAYYKLQRRWAIKPKHQLRDLAQHDPALAQQVRSILSDKRSVHQRCHLLAELVEQVLAPSGPRWVPGRNRTDTWRPLSACHLRPRPATGQCLGGNRV